MLTFDVRTRGKDLFRKPHVALPRTANAGDSMAKLWVGSVGKL